MLWQQHAEEMELIENNVLSINNTKITVEFQPSADQAWQHWAANVLTQSATYPSPYANVHKSQLCKIGGTIGFGASNTWNPPTLETRKNELEMLNTFKKSLPLTDSPATKHKKQLEYMAENGLRQLGPPRIGIFADRIRPEPLHLEINNWRHVLDILYKEAVRQGKFQKFITVLKNAPVNSDGNEILGCGLKFIAARIKEHYDMESVRMKKLATRLIGSQAISLAQYSYRITDSLMSDVNINNIDAKEIKCLALSKLCQTLRDIGALINRINVSEYYVEEVKRNCEIYFNLFSLFFPESCQSTVWTLSYALPFHSKYLYDNYKVGYGILSMQGKESKHSAIKQELKIGTNRSNSFDHTSKWNQVMRSSYVRNFYLPYHFPMPSLYHSHYRSRVPVFNDLESEYCACSRQVLPEMLMCSVCEKALPLMECVNAGEITVNVLKILKPIPCSICGERFADILTSDKHFTNIHNRQTVVDSKIIVPAILNVVQLKVHLLNRKLSTSGNKVILQRRLEGALSLEQ